MNPPPPPGPFPTKKEKGKKSLVELYKKCIEKKRDIFYTNFIPILNIYFMFQSSRRPSRL